MNRVATIVSVSLVAALAVAADAVAAADPALKCRTAKTRSAGDYIACREKALNLSLLKGTTADYSKCVSKFTEKWDKAELDASDACADDLPMSASFEGYLANRATEIADIVAGDTDVPACGDGAINAPLEHCDGAALDGLSCASFGLHGTLGCTTGCDLDLSGCTKCPSPGLSYGGSCWVLSDATHLDCDSACGALGMTYSDATLVTAGSDGSDANCVYLLDALGAPGGALDNAGGDCAGYGLGCSVIVNEMEAAFRARCGTPATTSGAEFAGVKRVCACE